MKCYNHENKEAVGLCKHCNKALCKECSTDLEYGLACKNRHEKEVEKINMIISKNIKIYSSKKQFYFNPIFFLFLGVVFSIYGYKDFYERDFSMPLILGIGMILFSFVLFIYVKSFNNTKSNFE